MNQDNQNTPGNQAPAPRPAEKIIQPTATFQPDVPQQTPPLQRPPVHTGQAEFANPPTLQSLDASQAFALKTMQAKTQDADRLVCMRIKSVLVISVIVALIALYEILASVGKRGGIILAIFGFVSLAMALGMVLSKDHHTVSLIIKIFLVLQLVSLALSLADPVGFIINGVCVAILAYAYFRVKALRYY